jgi:hypothetical protein
MLAGTGPWSEIEKKGCFIMTVNELKKFFQDHLVLGRDF